jgi:small subunit ribosomal protein S20
MANLKSSKKRAIQNVKKNKRNTARRSDIKTITKKFVEAIESNNVVLAQELITKAESKIARGKTKGVLAANTASRKISTLARKLAKLQAK